MSKPYRKSETWTEDKLRERFKHAADVLFQVCRFDDPEEARVVLVFTEGLTASHHISQVVIPELRRLYLKHGGFEVDSGLITGSLPLYGIGREASMDEISEVVFKGDLLLLFPASGKLFVMGIDQRPKRQPNDSSVEVSIKGPRDCFVEDISTNVALIRKRIRSQSLCCESFTIGRRTRTKVSLLYFDDILNPDVLREARRRLENIDIDGIYSINQLEEMLADRKYSIFPLLEFSGRPDFVVNSMLDGRFTIIIDGNPLALIGPAGLTLMLKSPEDIHFNFLYVSFSRFVRGISMFLSIFLPGIWVALMAFHQDQLPFRMMATVAVYRLGLPLSAQMEMFILLMLLEIFREAGVRLPSNIGQTLTSIGALIIGDAAIRAGLVSPSVVVIGAITAVSSVTLVNQALSTTVSVLRFVFFAMSALLGIYGLIIGLILLAAYMSSLSSFGRPYMAPWSPPSSFMDIMRSFLRLPWSMMKRRQSALHSVDSDHQNEGEQ